MSILDDLERLCALDAVSGFEEPVAEALRQLFAEAGLTVSSDRVGNLIGRRDQPGAPRLAVFAHMDEVGLMVSRVLADGRLRFLPIGGVDERRLPDQEVTVAGTRGRVAGVVRRLPENSGRDGPHRFVIETGLPPEQLRQAGVGPGRPASFRSSFRREGTTVSSKALDNRVGCTLLVALARRARAAFAIDFVGTVREEFGLAGVLAASRSLQPDVAIVLDVTYANDDDPPEVDTPIALGGGPAITMRDGGMVGYHRPIERAAALAEALGIPYQIEVVEEGVSEASRAHWAGGGAPAVGIFVPARHNHSAYELVDVRDLDATVELVAALLQDTSVLLP